MKTYQSVADYTVSCHYYSITLLLDTAHDYINGALISPV